MSAIASAWFEGFFSGAGVTMIVTAIVMSLMVRH